MSHSYQPFPYLFLGMLEEGIKSLAGQASQPGPGASLDEGDREERPSHSGAVPQQMPGLDGGGVGGGSETSRALHTRSRALALTCLGP